MPSPNSIVLKNVSEKLAEKINKENPSFDIILAITIAEIIYEIIICLIEKNKDKDIAYNRYKRMGLIERVLIKSYVSKYFPRGSVEHREVSKILIEEEFSKDTFLDVYKDILENK